MEVFEETYTLSDNGYKLLKYWQGNMFFFAPERIDNHGKYIHLRYWHDIDLLLSFTLRSIIFRTYYAPIY